jgi:hypothetical protein
MIGKTIRVANPTLWEVKEEYTCSKSPKMMQDCYSAQKTWEQKAFAPQALAPGFEFGTEVFWAVDSEPDSFCFWGQYSVVDGVAEPALSGDTPQ